MRRQIVMEALTRACGLLPRESWPSDCRIACGHRRAAASRAGFVASPPFDFLLEVAAPPDLHPKRGPNTLN